MQISGKIQVMIGRVIKKFTTRKLNEKENNTEGNTNNIITTPNVNFLKGRTRDNNIKRNLSKTFPT